MVLEKQTVLTRLRQHWHKSSHSERANFFEFIIERLIEKFCADARVAVDAGANYGAHTATMLKALEGRGKVIAFEANPHLAAQLRVWCATNPNLVVFDKALSDQNKKAEFFIAKDTGYSSLHLNPKIDFMIVDKVLVQTTKLDDEGINRIDFIKIDVEGAEIAVLRGSINTLKKSMPLVVMEINWQFSLPDDAAAATEFFDLLDLVKYDVYDCFGARLNCRNIDAWNVILAPRSRNLSAAISELCMSAAEDYFGQYLGWDPYQKFRPTSN